jgi:hypothetical protein
LKKELREYQEALAGYQGELSRAIFGKEESEEAIRLLKKIISRIQPVLRTGLVSVVPEKA